jgi:hypothetical protein
VDKRKSDGALFAWFGNDIVRVDNSTVVYSDAPMFQAGCFSHFANDRMVFDDNDNLWIGTLDFDADGTPLNYDWMKDNNGLYRISADFNSKIQVLDDSVGVWNVFKDSQGTIWASTNKGIYRIPNGQAPVLVYDGSAQSEYSNQVIENNGKIYAVIKNFFHNPNPLITPPDRNLVYDLYQWDGSTFTKICNIWSNTTYATTAFNWRGDLYVTMQGSGGTLRFNGEDAFVLEDICGDELGQVAKGHGDVIASVNNVIGIVVHNLNNDGQTIALTPVNTAEGLIRNPVRSLYLDSDDTLYIAPEASGFNTLSNCIFGNFEVSSFDDGNVAGFFKHDDRVFVSTVSNTYYLENGQLNFFSALHTNGDRIYHDREHLWAIIGSSFSGDGNLRLLNLTTKEKIEDMLFDQAYCFNDVAKVPGENAVFIGVGRRISEENHYGEDTPYVLKYYYETMEYGTVSLPDVSSKGIVKFGSDNDTLYGLSYEKLFKYDGNAWSFCFPIENIGDPTAVKRIGKYLFVTSSWGLGIIDLDSGTSEVYRNDRIALPSNHVTDLAVQDLGNDLYKLWFATRNGLASCQLHIPQPDED